MKIIIDNYSDYKQSQPLYLNQGFKKFGNESHVCDFAKDSIFDVCDTFNPNILIMSANRISHDAIQYLQQARDIQLLINIDTLSEQNVKELVAFIENQNVNIGFLFGANYNLPNKIGSINIVKINHAADINETEELPFDYKIDKAIILENPEENIGYKSSFHVISTNENMKSNADIVMPCISVRSLLPKYNEIIFKNITSINQLFLNALCSGIRTYYDNKDDSEIKKMLEKMLSSEFNINYNDENKISDFRDITKKILERHTGDNRAKTILSQIKGV